MRYTEQDFTEALESLGLTQDGPIRIGYLAATVTGPARTRGARVWVRVGTVADDVVWMRAESIEEPSREVSASVPVPRVLDTLTWERFDADEIATAAWAGPGQSERRVRRWTAAMTGGDRFADTPITWRPQHNDFHWQNLLDPKLTVVDWEGDSLAPAGSDAAQLLTYCLGHPSTAERVRELFSDVLDGESGLLAQVFAAANTWTAIRNGFHTHLEEPLTAHMRWLLGQTDQSNVHPSSDATDAIRFGT